MSRLWPFNHKDTQTPEAGISTEVSARSHEVPAKVFVGLDGPAPLGYEYSEEAPASVRYVDALLSGRYAAQNYLTLFKLLPEVFSAVNEIAWRVADCNWQLVKAFNDEVDYKDENFNRLFSQPNPLQNIQDIVYEAVCYEILTGRNFFYFNSSSLLAALDSKPARTLTWSNLAASHVRIDTKKNFDPYTATSLNDFILGYTIPTADGRRRQFELEKVFPVLHRDLEKPFDLNNTVPMIKGADAAIKNLIPVYEARGAIYIRRGPLGFFVSEKKDEGGVKAITPSEQRETEDIMNRENGLTGGRNLFRVAKAPVRFEKVGASISDLQPFDETTADAVAIYTAMRIPRHLVPTKDHSTFNNANQDEKSFYSNVILPWAKRYASIFTTALEYPLQRRYVKADFSHVDVLQENRKEKADLDKTNNTTYLLQWQSGIISLNDWIISTGGEKVNLAHYDKKIGEMTPEELEAVKSFLNLKTIQTNEAPSQEDRSTEKKS